MTRPDYQRVAEIAVDAVALERTGFSLTGQGSDRAEYRLDLRFDMPLDARTRAVLAELFSQSELTLSRRAPLADRGTGAGPRERAHRA